MPSLATRTFAAATAVVLAASAAHAQKAKPEPGSASVAARGAAAFSGVWEMNVEKSDFGSAAAQAPTKATMTITGAPASVKVAQTITMGGADMSTTSEYTLDGVPVTQSSPDGLPTTTAARLENGAIVLDSHMLRQGVDISRASRWTLSPDARVLTVVQKLHTPADSVTLNVVFDRKP
jgi:hypothetical protein